MNKAYMNWSGGKDSSLCLHRVLQEKLYIVDSLVTSVNSFHNRISMHGVRRELLEAQAASIGLPLQTIELGEQPGMEEYERATAEKVSLLKKKGCTHALFGDIFLEDLKRYREEELQRQEISCLFPLWKTPTAVLLREFLEKGFKAIIVCVNSERLDKSFCGRLIDESFVRDLPENVDPCGENGEYHSFVFEGPIFKTPIPFQKGEMVYREYKAPARTQTDDTEDLSTGNATAPASTTAPANPMDGASRAGFYFCDLLMG